MSNIDRIDNISNNSNENTMLMNAMMTEDKVITNEENKEENNEEPNEEENENNEPNDEENKEENEEPNELNDEDEKKINPNKTLKKNHIRKILKEISNKQNITQHAKIQLNELCIITCKLINKKIYDILTCSKKRTITPLEIQSAVSLIFNREFALKAIERGKYSLEQYLNNHKAEELKGHSRQTKASILIPPSILERLFNRYTLILH